MKRKTPSNFVIKSQVIDLKSVYEASQAKKKTKILDHVVSTSTIDLKEVFESTQDKKKQKKKSTEKKKKSTDKTKKKKKTTPPLHPWGRPVGGRDGDKIDIDAMALKLVGLDPEPLLKLVGCPEDLTFNDMTKLEACDIDESDFAALGVEDGDYKAAKKAANKKADKIIRQREKTFPAWCFLAYQAVDRVPKKEGQKPRNLCPISYDGKTVNTKLLLKKVDVFAKQRAFGKDIKFITTAAMHEKAAALLALSPKLNGNGPKI